jgi:aldose 1-epimerase
MARLDIFTNQPATQIYTAFLDEPRKAVHGGPNLTYGLFSAVALEQEGWLDAINTPAFHVNQICPCFCFCGAVAITDDDL